MRSDIGAVVDDAEITDQVCDPSSVPIAHDLIDMRTKACVSVDVEPDTPHMEITSRQTIEFSSTENRGAEMCDVDPSSSENEDDGLIPSRVASSSAADMEGSSTVMTTLVDATVHRGVQLAPALVEPQRERFLTAYERLSYDLANDRRCHKEITLGKRIGFYQLRSQIGCGNFSYVKLGVHILTREKVAVKILEKTRLDGKTRRLLSREITSMEQLHHPNIVRLYEVIETLSKLYIVLEYASEGELFTRITSQGGLSEADSRIFFAQIVSAVEHMHDKHIVHRDLKAENVFFSGPRQVKVGDFGFSTNCAADQTLSTFCGSPPYAAPELFRDDSYYGPNVDIWALGILLYFMVVGSLPFCAETVAKLKRCILDGVYAAPPDRVSDACRFLIRGILRPAPTDRYSLVEIRESEWLAGAEFPKCVRPHSLWPSHSASPSSMVARPPLVTSAEQSENGPRKTDLGVEANCDHDVENDDGAKQVGGVEDDDGAKQAGGVEDDLDRWTECEIETRRQLEEFGITEQHLMAAASRHPRSSVTGIYQIVLHSIEKKRQDDAAAAAAVAARDDEEQRNVRGGGDLSGAITATEAVADSFGNPPPSLIQSKKRSNVCVIL